MTDSEGFKAVDYAGVSSVMVEALKEQDKEIKHNDETLESLVNMMKEQDAMLARQESVLSGIENSLDFYLIVLGLSAVLAVLSFLAFSFLSSKSSV
mmetsp:Transcript_23676/g.59656  ORF Transcript_23676/g.59656 Transcript_23676/m.59656 type:complete len:96 (+) Transcript_23676:988-1275(+)